MLSRRDLLARALARAGQAPTGDDWEDEHALAGFLTDFRSEPAALRAFLEGVPDAGEICARYDVLVDAAGDGVDEERGSFDLYFVVRHPRPIGRDRAEQLVRAHYGAMAALARDAGEMDLHRRLCVAAPLEWVVDLPPATDSLDVEIYDLGCDLFDRYASEHPVLALHEAAYMIAASYEIARYVLWPAYRGAVDTDDPYAHFVELWRHGVGFQRADDRILASRP